MCILCVAACCSVLQRVAVRQNQARRILFTVRVSVCVCVYFCVCVCGCVCVCVFAGALQCFAECCSVLQRTKGTSILTKAHIRVVQCGAPVAVCCSVLQCVAVCCSVLQCVAVCCTIVCIDALSAYTHTYIIMCHTHIESQWRWWCMYTLHTLRFSICVTQTAYKASWKRSFDPVYTHVHF